MQSLDTNIEMAGHDEFSDIEYEKAPCRDVEDEGQDADMGF